jgi:hypothetical protein
MLGVPGLRRLFQLPGVFRVLEVLVLHGVLLELLGL